jgi:hypothetical protein
VSIGNNLRVSPQGDRVAFIVWPFGPGAGGPGLSPEAGYVAVVDRQGRKLVSTEWISIGGLAWAPDGKEVWFTASKTGFVSSLYALTLDGQERLIAEMDETIFLHDISHDGRVLVARGRGTSEARGRIAPEHGERAYSWLDGTTHLRFSRDGRLFIFSEMLEGGGPAGRAYVRRADSSPALWLGEGTALDISPDGKWVLCLSYGLRRQLRLMPTGGGAARPLRRGAIGDISEAVFLPDGKRIVLQGISEGLIGRLFIQTLPDGDPEPINAVGVELTGAASPDNRFVVARAMGSRRFGLYPVAGGEPRPIPDLGDTAWPLRFTSDGSALFVAIRSPFAAGLGIVRLDLATGRKIPFREITPPDSKGMRLKDADITPDGASYLYSYSRLVSDLYIIDGLR